MQCGCQDANHSDPSEAFTGMVENDAIIHVAVLTLQRLDHMILCRGCASISNPREPQSVAEKRAQG